MTQRGGENLEHEEEITKSKPGKDYIDELEQELHQKHDLSAHGVPAAKDLVEVCQGVYRCEE